MSHRHSIRLALHRFGVDVGRFPQTDPLWRTALLVGHLHPDVLFDVGANNGGFASAIRHLGYKGQIVSFEPLRAPYEALSRKAERDQGWTAVQSAIGAETRDVEINVAGNAGMSSSILPMLDAHTSSAPGSAYVGVETVRQVRLDDVARTYGLPPGGRAFLKIDVQGYERSVIEGARDLLRSGSIVGLEMELSLVPLYEGGLSAEDGIALAKEHGLSLVGLVPGFTDVRTGRLLQFDGVFARSDEIESSLGSQNQDDSLQHSGDQVRGN